MPLLSKYSTEISALEEECPASWQEGWWIWGEGSILGLAGSGRGSVAWVSSLGDFKVEDSSGVLLRCCDGVVHSGDSHAASSSMTFPWRTGKQVMRTIGACPPPGRCLLLCLCLNTSVSAQRPWHPRALVATPSVLPDMLVPSGWIPAYMNRWSQLLKVSCLPEVFLLFLFLFNRLCVLEQFQVPSKTEQKVHIFPLYFQGVSILTSTFWKDRGS